MKTEIITQKEKIKLKKAMNEAFDAGNIPGIEIPTAESGYKEKLLKALRKDERINLLFELIPEGDDAAEYYAIFLKEYYAEKAEKAATMYGALFQMV